MSEMLTTVNGMQEVRGSIPLGSTTFFNVIIGSRLQSFENRLVVLQAVAGSCKSRHDG